jgi:hypothetical protein
MEFASEDLQGMGTSLASQVNSHLLQAWNLPACLPATPTNQSTFEQWFEKGCRRSPTADLKQATILLAARKDDGTAVSAAQWQALTGQGIYMQALEEEEGKRLWESNDQIIALVWKSGADLRAGNQPVILLCRITTKKAGPTSRRRGTNQSPAPIAGFKAVIFDENQLAFMQPSAQAERSTTSIWSGLSVEFYDFEYATQRTDCGQVDAGVTPKYQFYLEVECVVFPADGDRTPDAQMVWNRESFAVAKSKDSARIEKIPGYLVPAELEFAIINCLEQTLLINPHDARVLPVSHFDRAKIDKRISIHPLHDTFIGPESRRHRDNFYQKSDPGTLVADIDLAENTGEKRRRIKLFDEPVERVQRLFTMPLEDLLANWSAIANELRSKGSGRKE